jgi:hypothetical protein
VLLGIVGCCLSEPEEAKLGIVPNHVHQPGSGSVRGAGNKADERREVEVDSVELAPCYKEALSGL